MTVCTPVFASQSFQVPQWDAGATSIASLADTGYYAFRVPLTVVGVIIGLGTDTSVDHTTIDNAFHFSKGTYRIVDRGVEVVAATAYAATDTFYVLRYENTVLYARKPVGGGPYSHAVAPHLEFPGEVIYVSPLPSFGSVFLDTSLYSGGDAVEYAERFTYTEWMGDAVSNPEAAGFTVLGIAGEPRVFGSGGFSVTGVASARASSGAEGTIQFKGLAFSGTYSLAEGGFSLGGEITQPGAYESPAVTWAVGYVPYSGIAGGHEIIPTGANGGFWALGMAMETAIAIAQGRFYTRGLAFGSVIPVNYITGELSFVSGYGPVHVVERLDTVLAHLENYAMEQRDKALLASMHKTFYNPQATVSEAIQAVLVAQPGLIVFAIEQATYADAITLVDAIELAERLYLEGYTETFRHAMVQATLGVALRDYLAKATPETVLDSLVGDDEAQHALYRLAQQMDQIAVSLDTEQLLTIVVEDTLSVDVDDAVQLLAHLQSTPTDRVDIWAAVRLSEEIVQGWVMNTEGQQPLSAYDNYEFNSYCRVGDTYFGARDDGLFQLDGDTDAGDAIDAHITSMMLDFGTSKQKRVVSAYLGYTAAGSLILKVRSVEDGEYTENWYEATSMVAATPRESVQPLGRGLKSRYWQFELANVAGADFEVDKLELYPLILSRSQ